LLHACVPKSEGSSNRLFSYAQRPDRFWSPPSLLLSEYQGVHAFPSTAEVSGRVESQLRFPIRPAWRAQNNFTRVTIDGRKIGRVSLDDSVLLLTP
jgi:hypothetical protein